MNYGPQQLEFLRKKQYITEDQNLEDKIRQISDVVARYESSYSEGLADRIAGYIRDQILSPSTPQWANLGKPENGGSTSLPVSCYITAPSNSIQGIYYSIGETAMMSKLGGGVGADFTNLHDKGTKIEDGFFTNAKLDWAEDLLRAGQKVSQGSQRRGYAVPFFSIDDPEFYDILHRCDKKNPDKRDPFVNNNVGFSLPIGFRDRLNSGDKEARKRFLLILKIREATGKVYLIDVENCNKNQSPVYEKLGHEVGSSNICVTGDQLVPTSRGFYTVQELHDIGDDLVLHDGSDPVKSSPMLLRNKNAEVFEITLANGLKHKVTKDHKVKIYNGRNYDYVPLKNLNVGDKVCFQTQRGVFGQQNKPREAFAFGMFQGDGSETGTNGVRLSLWENDFDLIDELESIAQDSWEKNPTVIGKPFFNAKTDTGDSNVARKDLHTVAFNKEGLEFRKGHIPNWILRGNELTQWQFVRGLLYSDGTVGNYNTGKSFGEPVSLSLASINLDFLSQVQLIFLNLGLNASIHNLRPKGKAMLPKNDGTGESKLYDCQPCYRLIVSNKNDLQAVESNTGFLSRKNVHFEQREYRDNSKKSSEIISILPAGREDVFCPSVDSEEHVWVCNGVITSNCTEITVPKYDDKSFACVLCSLNLVHWDKIAADPQIIKDAFMFLDINVSEFIRLTKGVPFMEKARRSAIEKRDIGLGTLGFHEYIQSKGAAYGDLHSRQLNKEIYSTIRKYGDEYAYEIAGKLGRPDMCAEAGLQRRNVSLMMIAPNKSTAFICGNTSLGIEPFLSNYFVKSLAGIQTTFKNPSLKKLLSEIGKDTPEVWESMLDNLGSVQHFDFLSEDQKKCYRTASEISPKDMIDLAADRQPFIDMSQSLNLFNRPNYSLQDIYAIHKYAFDRGIKSLYYYYPQGHAAIEKNGEAWDSCVACAD